MSAEDGAARDHRVRVPGAKSEAEEYEDSLRGLKKISLVTDVMTVCNWSLGFCALTWASAVLLGAYITELRVWDYYDVSVLLFVEGLRFGVAALIRMLGIYRVRRPVRFFLRSAQLFIPLWMGGFALLSILPVPIRDSIEDRFFVGPEHAPRSPLPQLNTSASAHIAAVAAHHAPHLPYNSLAASLNIFYYLILANAIVLLVGNTITGSMRILYVRSHAKSLYLYHDKLLLESSSWMQAGVDLDFAFKMQSFEYKRGKQARAVFRDYLDVIGYLYAHEKGVETAEVALEAEDVYVREAAAYMVGFWAVWEKNKGCNKLAPLRYQGQLLSLLVDLAEERYGATSSAAAWSLGLLMEASREENVKRMLEVLKRKEKKLLTMLMQRAEDVKEAEAEGEKTFNNADDAARRGCEQVRRNSSCHMYALKQLVGDPNNLEWRLRELGESEGAGNMQQLLRFLTEVQQNNDLATLKDLEAIIKEPKPDPLWRRSLKTALFVLLNVAVPLTLGFIVKAFHRH